MISSFSYIYEFCSYFPKILRKHDFIFAIFQKEQDPKKYKKKEDDLENLLIIILGLLKSLEQKR